MCSSTYSSMMEKARGIPSHISAAGTPLRRNGSTSSQVSVRPAATTRIERQRSIVDRSKCVCEGVAVDDRAAAQDGSVDVEQKEAR